MSERSHRHSRWRRRLNLLFALLCGLALFGFCVFHGISQADPLYATELSTAWVIAVLGAYSSYRVFKRAHRTGRVIATIALVLIISSIGVMTLLNRTPDPIDSSRPSPSTADE